VANAAKIGYDASLTAAGEERPAWVEVLGYCFLTSYVLELALRVASFGLAAFRNTWVKFDAVLVVFALADALVPLVASLYWPSSAGVFRRLPLIRLLRLARLAQLVRLMVEFRTLWLLVQGLVNSLYALFYTFVVIGVILYMFAVAAIMLIRPDETLGNDFNDVVARHFSSLPIALLTLSQGVTLDSFAGIYAPLVIGRPVLALYFVVFTLSVSIALMNLVTALTVEMAFAQAAADKEVKKAYDDAMKLGIVEELRQKFAEFDTDGSGQLGLSEIKGAAPELLTYIEQVAGSDEVEHIFRTLDYDNNNSLSIEEFCDGLAKFHTGKSLELACLLKICSQFHHEFKTLRTSCAPVERVFMASL